MALGLGGPGSKINFLRGGIAPGRAGRVWGHPLLRRDPESMAASRQLVSVALNRQLNLICGRTAPAARERHIREAPRDIIRHLCATSFNLSRRRNTNVHRSRRLGICLAQRCPFERPCAPSRVSVAGGGRAQLSFEAIATAAQIPQHDHFSGAGGASQQPSAPGSAPVRLRVGPVALIAPSR